MAEASEKPVVLVTGASGLLGRSIMKAFQATDTFKVVGTAFSRAKEGLVKLDLTKPEEIVKMISDIKPQIIIHAAAEKRPDVCENDEEATDRINGMLFLLCCGCYCRNYDLLSSQFMPHGRWPMLLAKTRHGLCTSVLIT